MMKLNNIFRFEQSSLALVLSNLVTIAVALWEKWNLSQVMWIYWGQSIIIGYYNWKRIRCLKQFSTENFKMNDKPVAATKNTQRQVASFFAMHYGFFHFGYLIFLWRESPNLSWFDIIGIVTCYILFALNHRFSFYQNLERDICRKPNIGTIMSFPYVRILPMHMTIILGSLFAKNSVGTLILFLGLKTFADLIMHLIEHRQSSKSVKPVLSESLPYESSETIT
jgi:ribosomal protein S18